MIGHTQSSSAATSAQRKKLWNPLEFFGIVNTDPGYDCVTCIGFAPSKGRRCRIQINYGNRALIMSVLDEISYFDPNSAAVRSRLGTIAEAALCVRFHQHQAEGVLGEWQRKIQQLKPRPEERRQTKSDQISHMQARMRVMREELARLEEELNNQRCQDRGDGNQEEHADRDRQDEQSNRRKKEEEQRERKKKERTEEERLEKERLEEEKKKKETLERERKERQEKQRREQEESANNERIRQKAQRAREERKQAEREREQNEQAEWDRSWTKYESQWALFKTSSTRRVNIRDAIPWPVKSGSYGDVKSSNVKEFFQRAVPANTDMAKLKRKECGKWHPDVTCRWLQGAQLNEVEQMMVDMISRVVTEF